MVINKDRGYVYDIEHHLAFCVKYRKKIFYNNIKIFSLIANEMDFSIMEFNTDLDHVHLLLNCKPQHYVLTIVQRLKGTSVKLLFQLYPDLK